VVQIDQGITVNLLEDWVRRSLLQFEVSKTSLIMVALILWQEIGFKHNEQQGECLSKFACHLDCFAWVKRDSYLPQGSQGLKVQLSFSQYPFIADINHLSMHTMLWKVEIYVSQQDRPEF